MSDMVYLHHLYFLLFYEKKLLIILVYKTVPKTSFKHAIPPITMTSIYFLQNTNNIIQIKNNSVCKSIVQKVVSSVGIQLSYLQFTLHK